MKRWRSQPETSSGPSIPIPPKPQEDCPWEGPTAPTQPLPFPWVSRRPDLGVGAALLLVGETHESARGTGEGSRWIGRSAGDSRRANRWNAIPPAGTDPARWFGGAMLVEWEGVVGARAAPM
jgi:hypothetical protein